MEVEEKIIKDMVQLTGYDIGKGRNVNSLSGGQRSILYLITLSYIVEYYKQYNFKISLFRVLESLTLENREKITKYLEAKKIVIEVTNGN